MAKKEIIISEVFKTIGQPTITYVERQKGYYERQLSDAIDSKGQLCLITGASKTGKTTLYKRVLSQKNREPIIIRCDKSLTSMEFWRKSLEQIDAERISQKTDQRSSEISGGFSWGDPLGVFGRGKLDTSRKFTESEMKERVLSDPSPDHLLVALKKLQITLVVEDFHYLADEVKTVVFQQWKNFVDNEVSVVVLGTTHRAVDIANSNRDLLGRICQIDISRWNAEDLTQIMSKGFEHIGLGQNGALGEFIARESVGLPIITQQACLQLFRDKNLSQVQYKPKDITFSKADGEQALHNVAITNYKQLDHDYKMITKGPRQRARKYNTYEMIMLCFAQDPLQFELSRSEIDRRLSKLGIAKPPAGSVTSTLSALGKFQSTNKMELLEWIPKEKMLYMVEPSFLFYVRWREKRPIDENSTLSYILFKPIAPEKLSKVHADFIKAVEDMAFYFGRKS